MTESLIMANLIKGIQERIDSMEYSLSIEDHLPEHQWIISIGDFYVSPLFNENNTTTGKGTTDDPHNVFRFTDIGIEDIVKISNSKYGNIKGVKWRDATESLVKELKSNIEFIKNNSNVK